MATGYLYEGFIERIGRLQEQGSTIFYLKLDSLEYPIRLNPLNLSPSERAMLSWSRCGGFAEIRCDWENLDMSFKEGISYSYRETDSSN